MLLPNIEGALRGAARRVPGQAARNSLARWQEHRSALMSVPVPEPLVKPGPVPVRPDECWCQTCGDNTRSAVSLAPAANKKFTAETCYRCGSVRLVPVTTILHENEFYVSG